MASLLLRLGHWLTIGAGTGLIGVGLLRLLGQVGGAIVIAGAMMVGLGVAIAMAVRDRWDESRAARELDRVLGLKDRLSSGLAMHEAAGGFARVAVDAAEATAAEVDSAKAVPVRIPRTHLVWPLVLAGAIAALRLPVVRWEGESIPPPDRGVIAHAVDQVQQAAAAIEQIERAADMPGLDEYAAEIASIERELESGRSDANGALAQSAKALDAAGRRIEERAREQTQAIEQLRENLARAGEIADERAASLARSIAKGDMEAAAREASRLSADAATMPAEERERIARGLEEMARAIDGSMSEGELKDAQPSTAQGDTGETSTLPAKERVNEPAEGKDQASRERTAGDEKAAPTVDPREPVAEKPESSSTKPTENDRAPETKPGEKPPSESSEGSASTPQDEGQTGRDGSTTPNERVRDALREAAEELRRSGQDGTTPPGDQQRKPEQGAKPTRDSPPTKPGEKQSEKPGDPTGVRPGEKSGDKPARRPGENTGEVQGEKTGEQPGEKPGDKPGQPRREPSPSSPTGQPEQREPGAMGPVENPSPSVEPRPEGVTPGERPAAGDRPSPGKNESGTKPQESTEPSGEPSAPEVSKEQQPPKGTQGAPDSGVTTPAPGQQSVPGPSSQSPDAGATPRQSRPGEPGQDGTRVPRPATDGTSGEVLSDTSALPGGDAKPSPTGTKPTREGQSPSQGGEGVKPPDAGTMKPGGDASGPTPTDAEIPDAKGLERLEKELLRMAEEGRTIDRRLLESQSLREQARRMLDQASPEQRERLEDLAQRLIGGEGSKRGGPITPPTPRRELDQVPTAPVDARGTAPDAGGPTIAQWLGEGERGVPQRERLAEGVRRAAAGIEQSLEQQAVPARHGDFVRRVFERYVRRAQSPGAEGSSSPPVLQDAPDAPRR